MRRFFVLPSSAIHDDQAVIAWLVKIIAAGWSGPLYASPGAGGYTLTLRGGVIVLNHHAFYDTTTLCTGNPYRRDYHRRDPIAEAFGIA
jgi:hypothetical protein